MQSKTTRKKSKKAKKLPPNIKTSEEDTAATVAALMTPPTSPTSFGVTRSPTGPPTMALMAAGMAMVSAGDGELQNKLKKWKQSADTARFARLYSYLYLFNIMRWYVFSAPSSLTRKETVPQTRGRKIRLLIKDSLLSHKINSLPAEKVILLLTPAHRCRRNPPDFASGS